MTELLEAARDALAELEALITGRGPYAGQRVVGPDAGRVADRLRTELEKAEAVAASYEPPLVLASSADVERQEDDWPCGMV